MIIRELLTRWGVKVDARALELMDRKIDVVKKRFDEAGERSIKFGEKMSLFVTAPLLAAAGVMVKTAAEAEQTKERFNSLFRTIEPLAQQTAKTLADAFGLSITTAETYLSKSGQILESMRFSETQALSLGSEITKLSLDIAAFSNVEGGAETVLRAVSNALAGNVGMLRKTIGTVIEDTEIQAVANQMRMQGVRGTKAQVDALATLRLIQQKNNKALGAYVKDQDGLEGSLKATHEVLKDVAIGFGELLLPPVLKVLKGIRALLKVVRDLPSPLKVILIIIGGLAAAIGPVLIAFGMLQKTMVGVNGLLQTLFPAFKGLTWAGLATAGAWALAFLAIFLIFEDLYSFLTGKKSISKLLVEEFGTALDWISQRFEKLPTIVKGAMALVLTPIRATVNAVQALAGILGALSTGNFQVAGSLAKEALGKYFKDTVMPDLNDAGSILGFSRDEHLKPTPGMASAGTGAGGTNMGGVNVQNTITVPPGTPPQLVGDAVTRGVKTSMDEALRQAFATMKPHVEF